ncbi:MAG TPA: hypothetical protein PK177_18505 [Burkholderiaceae bacterium]|nr:hypothetical protein [Burkholderiaceae bacterium]
MSAKAERNVPAGSSPAPLPGFSAAATEIAVIIGAHSALERIAALEATAPGAGPAAQADALRLLALRQNVMDLIVRAMLDVSSVISEIGCENERGDQLRDYLDKLENRRMRSLGVGSILVGAVTAFLSGGLALLEPHTKGSDIVGILGGATEVSIGVAGLSDRHAGKLGTERNLMRDVWEAPMESTLFPASVWRFMNSSIGLGPGAPTQRELLIAEWRTGDRLGSAGSDEEEARAALFFGSGGTYGIDDLNTRDSLLDLLEATVHSMNQYLRLLLDELMSRSERVAG